MWRVQSKALWVLTLFYDSTRSQCDWFRTSSKRYYCQTKNGNDNRTTWKLEHINYYCWNEMSAFTQSCCKYPTFFHNGIAFIINGSYVAVPQFAFCTQFIFAIFWCIKRWVSRYFTELLAPTHRPHKAISFEFLFAFRKQISIDFAMCSINGKKVIGKWM